MNYDVIRHAIKHSEDEVEAEIINDDVEIIEAPYPENGKAQIPRRSFIYDDEDGYPQDYFEHHGILGMKWGVRRYQNADGSLTPAGVKRYGKQVKRHNENINYAMYKRSLPKVSAEDHINRELKRGKIDEKQANKLRQAANNLTSYYDFLSDQSVLSKEIEYDNMQKYIIDNFGKTSLEEVNKWASSHLNSRTFDSAIKNVEDYKKLKEENDKLLEDKKPQTYKPYGTDLKTYNDRVLKMTDALKTGDKETYDKIRSSFETGEDMSRAEWEAESLLDKDKKK